MVDRPAGTARARTIAGLLPWAAETFGDRVAIRHRRDGRWHDITFAALADQAGEIGRGLIALGVRPGDRVGVLSQTRPEWTAVALGITMAGAVIVPVYPSSSAEECAWVLGNSGAVAAVCADEGQVGKVGTAVRHVVSMEPAGATRTVADLRAIGRGVPDEALRERRSAVTGDDRFTIVYTSGTTGPAKGCVHTHAGYRAGLDTILARDVLSGADDLVYLFLPLAHSFALMVQFAALDTGTPVAYHSGDPLRIIPEMAEVRPTYLPSVPRIFEKIYRSVSGGVDPAALAEAVAVGGRVQDLRLAGQTVPDDLASAYDGVDSTLFAKVRAVFGGRLRAAASGAAPIAPEILEFFHAAGIPVLEGWGLTETAVAVTTSSPGHHRFGSVGRAVPGVRLRIADDGEVLVRGRNVFSGYLDDPEASAAVLRDGWLHTGDLGSLDDEGYLTIVGRKKDIIITAGGKNLSPTNIENDLKRCRWISHAVVHGDRRPYPVVLITLDADEVLPWARRHNLPADIPALAAEPRLHALIQAELHRVNQGYATAAQVKKFVVLDRDLTPEAGELTRTLKVRRDVVNVRYGPLFDALYAQGTQSSPT